MHVSVVASLFKNISNWESSSGYKFAQIEMSECIFCLFWFYPDIVSEIILATLLRRFKFSPTKDEVIWNLSQIISPSVRRLDEGGFVEEKGLPLVVELRAD